MPRHPYPFSQWYGYFLYNTRIVYIASASGPKGSAPSSGNRPQPHCNITIVEWAAWLSDVYNGRNYDLTVVGHTGRLDPYVLLARYQSDSSENYFNYSNEEVDQLLADYKSETDEDKRTEIVQRVQEILAQDVPAYYIQDPITIYVTDSAVTGFQLYPIDIYELKDISLGQ